MTIVRIPRQSFPGFSIPPTPSLMPPTKARGMPSSSGVPTWPRPPAFFRILAQDLTRAIWIGETAPKDRPLGTQSHSIWLVSMMPWRFSAARSANITMPLICFG